MLDREQFQQGVEEMANRALEVVVEQNAAKPDDCDEEVQW